MLAASPGKPLPRGGNLTVVAPWTAPRAVLFQALGPIWVLGLSPRSWACLQVAMDAVTDAGGGWAGIILPAVVDGPWS